MSTTTTSTETSSTSTSRWFAIPAPLRSLFKLFPLKTYSPEPLPYRSPGASPSRPRLYVYADEASKLSYNPSCLKSQTLLRIAGVDVDIVPSNNHASPSGALPFILTQGGRPVTAERIAGFAREESGQELRAGPEAKVEAYRALISQAIRPAWVCSLRHRKTISKNANPTNQLYALYLNPLNHDLLQRLYLPSNPLLRLPTHQTLTQASTAEILKTTNSNLISPSQLHAELRSALEALSTLLGDDDWFFGGASPGPFDAEVFAYTWLMGDKGLGWGDDALESALSESDNLERHRVRLYEVCWGNGKV